MSQRHYYRDVSGTLHEQSDAVPQQGWSVQTNAEEGSVGSSRITIDDPDMDKDFIGHRRWLVIEDESESDDDVLWSGYTGTQDISRGFDADSRLTLGRVWTVELWDVNTIWSRRIMRSAKRPAETDVQRMQWLLGTTELSPWLENVTDYVDTSSPVSMSKNDYTGQTTNSIADDIAQQSGKNWFVAYINNGVDREMCAFYGDYTYDSPLFISNDRSDWDLDAIVDGSALYWPIGKRTNLRRDPSRVFSGAYGEWEKGRLYRRRASTESTFALGHRDMSVPMPNVKSKAAAAARLEKALDLAATQDERVTTEVVLPNAKATMLKPGMRVRFKATHEPGYESFRWMRILNAIPAPIAGGNKYRIALELQGPGEEYVAPWVCPIDAGITATEGKFYPALGSATTDADGNVWYSSGNLPFFGDSWDFTSGPRPSTSCTGFGFPAYGISGGDAGGTGTSSVIGFVFAGVGTIDATLTSYLGTNAGWEWLLYYEGPSGSTLQDSDSGFDAGDVVAVDTGDLPGDAVSCYRFFVMKIGNPIGGGGTKLVFPGLTWTPS